jgi:hypothetical protein
MMAYVVAIAVFLIALVATVLLFGQFMTRDYVEMARSKSGDRELNGLLMLVIPAVAALIAFWLVR